MSSEREAETLREWRRQLRHQWQAMQATTTLSDRGRHMHEYVNELHRFVDALRKHHARHGAVRRLRN